MIIVVEFSLLPCISFLLYSALHLIILLYLLYFIQFSRYDGVFAVEHDAYSFLQSKNSTFFWEFISLTNILIRVFGGLKWTRTTDLSLIRRVL